METESSTESWRCELRIWKKERKKWEGMGRNGRKPPIHCVCLLFVWFDRLFFFHFFFWSLRWLFAYARIALPERRLSRSRMSLQWRLRRMRMFDSRFVVIIIFFLKSRIELLAQFFLLLLFLIVCFIATHRWERMQVSSVRRVRSVHQHFG